MLFVEIVLFRENRRAPIKLVLFLCHMHCTLKIKLTPPFFIYQLLLFPAFLLYFEFSQTLNKCFQSL